MTISNALLKPYLQQLQKDLEQLFERVCFESDFEIVDIKSKIQQQLSVIADLNNAVTVLENHHTAIAPFELYATYKEVKRAHHALKRTLERFNSNQERIRKMQERRSHVAIFAA